MDFSYGTPVLAVGLLLHSGLLDPCWEMILGLCWGWGQRSSPSVLQKTPHDYV